MGLDAKWVEEKFVHFFFRELTQPEQVAKKRIDDDKLNCHELVKQKTQKNFLIVSYFPWFSSIFGFFSSHQLGEDSDSQPKYPKVLYKFTNFLNKIKKFTSRKQSVVADWEIPESSLKFQDKLDKSE